MIGEDGGENALPLGCLFSFQRVLVEEVDADKQYDVVMMTFALSIWLDNCEGGRTDKGHRDIVLTRERRNLCLCSVGM